MTPDSQPGPPLDNSALQHLLDLERGLKSVAAGIDLLRGSHRTLVRFGSQADVGPSLAEVRFGEVSGQSMRRLQTKLQTNYATQAGIGQHMPAPLA